MTKNLIIFLFFIQIGKPMPEIVFNRNKIRTCHSIREKYLKKSYSVFDDNNQLQYINFSIPAGVKGAKCRQLKGLLWDSATEDDISFYLYTKLNKDKPVTFKSNQLDLIKNSTFNYQYGTKILVHGFANGYKNGFIQRTKDAYLDNMDVNIIAVDWSTLAAAPWYFQAVRNTNITATTTAKLINYLLTELKVSLDHIHLIGHSLGAHVSGIIGKNINAPGKLKRITGLDPAKPFYEVIPKNLQLIAADAELVDIVHTSGGLLGILVPIGRVDFYANGGISPQPECSSFNVACSHSNAWVYFADSIKSKEEFQIQKCTTLFQAVTNRCNIEPDIPTMGEYAFNNIESAVSGIYYIKRANNT